MDRNEENQKHKQSSGIFVSFPATAVTLELIPATEVTFADIPATVLMFVLFPATVLTLVIDPATVPIVSVPSKSAATVFTLV